MFAWRDSSRRGLARRRRRASRRRRARRARARRRARRVVVARTSRRVVARRRAREVRRARAPAAGQQIAHTTTSTGDFRSKMHARDKSRVSRAASTPGREAAIARRRIRLLATRDRPSTPWGCVSRRSTLDAMRSTRARRDARGSRVARATRDDDDDANASLGL